jgi:hypothetical protein
MNTSKRMLPEMWERYQNSPPLAMDAEIRAWAGVPSNRYYSVSTYPESVAGIVHIDLSRERVVKPTKISKSDQP